MMAREPAMAGVRCCYRAEGAPAYGRSAAMLFTAVRRRLLCLGCLVCIFVAVVGHGALHDAIAAARG